MKAIKTFFGNGYVMSSLLEKVGRKNWKKP